MRKKLTLLFIDEHGSPLRSVAFSRKWLYLSVLLTLALTGAAGYGYHEFCGLQQQVAELKVYQESTVFQRERIVLQNRQIQDFAQNINTLNTKLAELYDFEKKVRIIANLDPPVDQEAFLGVGGSPPEALNTRLPLSEDHKQLMREMHQRVDITDMHAGVQQQSFEKLLKKLNAKRSLLAATPSIRPLDGWKTSGFGYRRSPFTGRRELHKGLDIAAPKGSPIIAPADGVVTFSSRKGLMGNMITLKHGYGIVTRYGHLAKMLKKKGEKVNRGEVIALVGSTGRSTGPHLHYEVRLNGVPVNPEKYILN
ncbi:MAG: M23 family metallopeptidase [Desulfosarcinaceae bacterium]|nr:M23 family metallopeptidase [Desulfosarcinaceae bacterium]